MDDTEYKPGRQPIVTARPQPNGDIFDVTVSAIQGPGYGGQGKPFVTPGKNVFLYLLPASSTNTSCSNGGVRILSGVGSLKIKGDLRRLNFMGAD